MTSRRFRGISTAAAIAFAVFAGNHASRAWRSAIGDVMGWLEPLTAPRLCGLCGNGYASTGWMVDPVGRVSGRCLGCMGDTPTYQELEMQTSPSFQCDQLYPGRDLARRARRHLISELRSGSSSEPSTKSDHESNLCRYQPAST